MKSRQKLTNYDKRKLTYDRTGYMNPSNQSHPLDLPPEFENKISSTQYRKLKQAYFIEAEQNLTLTRNKFPIVMRSLGIILNTGEFYKIFEQIEEKTMTWKQFLQAYVAKRSYKGSYNQLSHAVYELSKEYRGDWDDMMMDLQTLGDVLTREEVQVLKKDILKGGTMTSQSLINGLLYEK